MSTQNEHKIMLRIEPLDLLLFREGRPFGVSTKVSSGLPMPQTIAGALRTAMLRKFKIPLTNLGEYISSGDDFESAMTKIAENFPEISDSAKAIGSVRFQGPWFGLDGDGMSEEILFPLPASLKLVKGEEKIVRYAPLKDDIPGWNTEELGRKPLWTKSIEKLESRNCYLTSKEMKEFLIGKTPSDVVESSRLYVFADRTGIAVDSKSLATQKGMIYSASMLSLKPEACILVELSGSTEFLQAAFGDEQIVAVGGESRHARVSTVPVGSNYLENMKSLMNTSNLDGEEDGRMIVLTTPALLNGWCPKGLNPLSAAVPGYDAVSGWNMAKNGPKSSRFPVKAGAVYFFEQDNELSPGSRLSLGEDPELGWGSYLEGKWNYA